MHRFSKEKIKKQNIIVLIILVILAVIGLVIHAYFNQCLKPVDRSDRQVRIVTIPQNTTDKGAADILHERGLVRNSYVFYYFLQTHKTHGIKAGKFKISPSQSVPEISWTIQNKNQAR